VRRCERPLDEMEVRYEAAGTSTAVAKLHNRAVSNTLGSRPQLAISVSPATTSASECHLPCRFQSANNRSPVGVDALDLRLPRRRPLWPTIAPFSPLAHTRPTPPPRRDVGQTGPLGGNVEVKRRYAAKLNPTTGAIVVRSPRAGRDLPSN
jgi:hypothetical protein